MLWKVRISTRRKLALGGVFCVTVITVIFAIVRVAVVATSASGTADMSWLYAWSNIEAGAGTAPFYLSDAQADVADFSHHRVLHRVFPKPLHISGLCSKARQRFSTNYRKPST